MHVETLEGRRLFSGVAAKFVAPLVGANEVPAVQSPAAGTAKLTLSRDGASLRYQIKVKHLLNGEGAHIHLGPAGQAGEIVADLMNSGRMHMGKKSFSTKGTITAAQLTGSLAGHPLSDLVVQMMAGTAYVNVHTDDGTPPANTGPGDFPDGEVRGQISQVVKRRRPTNGQSTGGQSTGATGGTGSTGGQAGGTGSQTGGAGNTGGNGNTGGAGGTVGGQTGETGGAGGYYKY